MIESASEDTTTVDLEDPTTVYLESSSDLVATTSATDSTGPIDKTTTLNLLDRLKSPKPSELARKEENGSHKSATKREETIARCHSK